LKGRLIKKVLRQAHRERVEEATSTIGGLWKLVRWARNRGQRQAVTPPLKRADGTLEDDPQKKTKLLRKTFFPQPQQADLSDLEGYEYPAAINLPPITTQEIELAIRRARTGRAPGNDGIPVLILKIACPILLPYLHLIYNTCLTLGYCPTHFRSSITVALRKQGKEDYTEVKSYRPVALLNTIGKVLEAVIAQKINFAMEIHNLLPRTHIGGRRASSTEHAMHLMIERIHAGWDEYGGDGVATVLSLDVSGAFDYVSHPRLLHNLRKRQIDGRIVRWISSFLVNRTTTIRLNEYTSEPMDTSTGIPQGSPLSPILYLFYNADLLDNCEDSDLRTSPIGYIDDVNIITYSDSTETNCRNLQAVYARCQDWERKHASKFNPTKYKLIHLFRRRRRHDMQCPLVLPGMTLQPVGFLRFLGIIIDSKLSWGEHISHIQAQATKTLGALASLGGSTWGTNYKGLRQIYTSVVAPQLLYGCSAWYAPSAGCSKYSIKKLEKLASIQARAARIITGAFKATSIPALDIEAFLTPIRQRLEEAAANSFLRIAASPLMATYQGIRRTQRRRREGADWALLPQMWTPLERHAEYCRSRLGSEAISNLEWKLPFTVAPWWEAPTVIIEDNAESAKETHQRILSESETPLAVYTDGSGINNKIGAAAVAPRMNIIKQAYMGSEKTSTVYAGELEGIRMALEIATTSNRERVVVFSDSQAALKAIRTPGRPSGQYILAQIVQALDHLKQNGRTVELRWIPAHQGIEGNELADRAAKEATGWRIIRRKNGRKTETDSDQVAQRPPIVMHTLAAVRQTIKKSTRKEWEETWKNESRGRDLYKITLEPTRAVLQLHSQLNRPLSSILTQMRTGKIGLRSYLHSRHVPDIADDRCECGLGPQTVAHVLFNCQRQAHLRKELWMEGDGKRKRRITSTSLKVILSTPAYAIKAAKFLKATGLLGQFRSCETTDQAEQ
jgi:ribonuclease HI